MIEREVLVKNINNLTRELSDRGIHFIFLTKYKEEILVNTHTSIDTIKYFYAILKPMVVDWEEKNKIKSPYK